MHMMQEIPSQFDIRRNIGELPMNEPNGGDATTPVRGDGAATGGSAKKRLLPMELRRRRKAAKLQITSDRNVATISAKDIIENIEDPELATQAPQLSSKPDEATATNRVDAAHKNPRDSSAQASHASKQAEPDDTVALPKPAATTTKQLQSLFSFSLKRQKQQQREALVDVPMSMQTARIPLDLAAKSKVVVTIAGPFPFLRPRASSLAASMSDQQASHPEVRWLKALQYYVHPASSLPPSLSVASDKQLEESVFYVQRFQQWQTSFRHAYLTFRKLKATGTLYVRYPEFVACFLVENGARSDTAEVSIMDLCQEYVAKRDPQEAPPTQRRRRLCATISLSNARLRKDLQQRGIEFSVPFNTRAMQQPISNLSAEDDAWATANPIDSSATQQVHGPDSLLHFDGHQSVHGLYEFLLNRKPLSNQDVPEIIAHHPFANAAIRSVAVRYMGKGGDTSRVAQSRSEIELTGFCTSTAVAKLVSCLEDVGGGDDTEHQSPWAVKVAMETAPMCERLNAALLDSSQIRSAHATLQQREQWKQRLDFAKRRLQTIHKGSDKNEFQVDLTSRS